MEKQRLFSELDRSHTDEPATDTVRDDLREVHDPDEGDDPGQLARV